MRASGYDRIAADFYCEPKWIVDALLDVEELPGMSWDPCCGGGNIPVTMRARGLPCRGSDIANRIRRDGRFLRGARHGGQHRYESALRHDRAVHRAGAGKDDGQVFVLAWLALLEGMRRHQMLFQTTPLARVRVSSRRVSMPPGATDIKASGGSIAYAWFVWDHSYLERPPRPITDWV
jgi:hypothetical protein